jgi:NAD(P)-dependent dehydrogenase (short-subunit alcohol dehydrogenase family)
MDLALPAPEKASTAVEDVSRAVAALEALAGDPALMALLPDEERVRLMQVAGKLARPTALDRSRMRKAKRRQRAEEQRVVDKQARDGVGIREARQAAVFQAPDRRETPAAQVRHLQKARFCYVCKVSFTKLHFFYDSMCDDCGEFNYAKRFQTANLAGQTALITGARLKIGYQAALMMLRAGARVIATTRFPQDAAIRYSQEKDYDAWKDRLSVHGLDLRHSPSVEIFCRYLDSSEKRLDLLINNAAQTVRRPPAFYEHLLATEALPAGQLPRAAAAMLESHETCKTALLGAREREAAVDTTGLAVWHQGSPGVGIRESARLSQLRYAYDDAQSGRELFPAGHVDADLQQVDLRLVNSWRLRLADVPTPELLEVQLVNAVAPYILCAKLKPLMLRVPTGGQHVVNVSAMEGSFSRHTKTDKHPHTNMAKAALNMMTLTSAPDFLRDGIHMNAVDTGWVTDEDPAQHSTRKRDELDFQPPLDIVDGAARVCDPFFSGLNAGEHLWGKFFKDYKPTPW